VSVTGALARAGALLALLAVVSVAYLTMLGAREVHRYDGPPGPTADTGHAVWREAWSRRFPGCVALLLWPPHEVPRALVVRDGNGDLRQLSVRQAVVEVRSGAPRPDTVGACR
jgi:hypothetical protein